MKYSISIDNVKSQEWDLNLQQAYVFAWIYSVPSWADRVIIENNVYYFASRRKFIEDMPLLTDKSDTVYRAFKQLEEKGLIKLIKIDGRDFICLTEKAKEWNNFNSEKNPTLGKKSDTRIEKDPILDENSEKNPNANSENFPTYNNISIIDNNIINNNTFSSNEENSFLKNENFEFQKKEKEIEEIDLTQIEIKNEKIQKEKSSAKKEKVEKEPSPYFSTLSKLWFDFYEFNFNFKPVFTATDGAKLRSIISKLSQLAKDKGRIFNEDNAKDYFKRFLELSYQDEFYRTNYSLSILDSKFNQIIAKSTKNGSTAKEHFKTTSSKIDDDYNRYFRTASYS